MIMMIMLLCEIMIFFNILYFSKFSTCLYAAYTMKKNRLMKALKITEIEQKLLCRFLGSHGSHLQPACVQGTWRLSSAAAVLDRAEDSPCLRSHMGKRMTQHQRMNCVLRTQGRSFSFFTLFSQHRIDFQRRRLLWGRCHKRTKIKAKNSSRALDDVFPLTQSVKRQ